MLFAKIVNNVVQKFPYVLEDLQKDNKNVSFTSNIFEDLETLKDYNVYPIIEVDPPAVSDPILYSVALTDPENINGQWYKKWNIVPTGITIQEIINTKKNDILKEVQNNLDQFAKQNNYDNIISCCSYFNSSIAKYQQEAKKCIKLRDCIWDVTYEKIAELENNTTTNWVNLSIPHVFSLILEKLYEKYSLSFSWTVMED